MRPERLRILLLADSGRGHAPTLNEHVASLARRSRHDVKLFNPRGVEEADALRLDEFDVVVVHYSLMILADQYLSPWFRERIAEFDGLKVQFIQDDYRYIADMWAMMRFLGIDLLFTLVPEREIERVWPERELPGMRKVTTLAGYVPHAARRVRTSGIAARPIDVGYRGRPLPPWLGILGQEKLWIAQGFLARAAEHGLRCDISWTENARLYGPSWFKFVGSCRVTLGTESGATISDFDGSIERRARDYQAANPAADFWEVHREVLAPYEGNVRMNVISPRIFEAAALRTGLVLYPGEYSGVLERDRHYIALEKDFSNMDEVVAAIRDTQGLEALAARTFTEIVESPRYSYAAMVAEFDRHVGELGRPRRSGMAVGFYRARAASCARQLAARPREALGSMGGRLACLRLIAQDRVTRRLLACWLVKPSIRAATLRQKLWEDLVRLALIRRANVGRLTAGPDFVVEPAPGGTVATPIVASRCAADEPLAATPARVEDACARAAITWDHAAVAAVFAVPLTRARWAWFPVSPQGGAPIYQFGAVHALRPLLPALVDEAVAGVFTVERERRTSPDVMPVPTVPARVRGAAQRAASCAARPVLTAVARARGIAAALRQLPEWLRTGGVRVALQEIAGALAGPARAEQEPVVSRLARVRRATRALAFVMSIIVGDPHVRSLLTAFVRSPRLWRAFGPRTLIAECLLLDTLGRAARGELVEVHGVDAERHEDGTLLLRSRPRRRGAGARRDPAASAGLTQAVAAAGFERIVWDNSAVGLVLHVPFKRGTHPVGVVSPDGRRELVMLSKLATTRPHLALPAIASCLAVNEGGANG